MGDFQRRLRVIADDSGLDLQVQVIGDVEVQVLDPSQKVRVTYGNGRKPTDWHDGYQEALRDVLDALNRNGGDTAYDWCLANGDAETTAKATRMARPVAVTPPF